MPSPFSVPGSSSSEHRPAHVLRTRAGAGAALQSVAAGPVGWGVAIFVIVPFAMTWLETGVIEPFLAASGTVAFVAWVLLSYVHEILMNDDLPDPAAAGNIAAELSADLAGRLAKSGVSGITLLDAAVTSPRGAFILNEIGIAPRTFLFRCSAHVEQALNIEGFLAEAHAEARRLEESRIGANAVLSLLLRRVPECRQILYDADLSEEDLERILAWEQLREKQRRSDRWWRPRMLERTLGCVGQSWVMGYTDALDRMTQDMGARLPLESERGIVLHRDDVSRTVQVLTREHHRNAIIIGKPGTGRRTLIENVAAQMRDAERAGHRAFTRVLKLRTEELLAGTDASDKALLAAFGRAEARGRFLLVIHDISSLLKARDERMLSVLRRFLESKTISVLAVATPEEYHAVIKRDPAMDTLFEKITISDASSDETMAVLMAHALRMGRLHRGAVTYRALVSTAKLTREYMANAGFPGAAVSVIEDAVALARSSGGKVVEDRHVREVISIKAKVDVRPAGTADKDKLLQLQERMQAQVIGQDHAVHALVAALKRSKLDLRERTRPIGTFLFIGPTGVGKTQTSKVLAEEMFGGADRMIRLDMNEFSHPDAVFAITGRPDDSGPQESDLIRRIQAQPFAVVLLDEVEKAHKSVLNLFLQILDEGVLTDAAGRTVDFRSTIIIATSNAGALFIRDWWTQNPKGDMDDFRKLLLDHILHESTFTPEFVNRFDAVVAFRPLDKAAAAKVAALMLQDITDDIRDRRGITVQVEPGVVKALVERGHSVEFGARELRRTITDIVENRIADVLLQGAVQRGGTVVIKAEDLRF